MSKEEQTGRSSPSFSPSDHHQYSDISGQGVAPDLEFVHGTQTTVTTEGLASDLMEPPKLQKWHRPYAEAILETDPGRAGAAISNAKSNS
jgi:hypothetical protein